MAVTITTYHSKKYFDGAKPSIPSFVEEEPQPVLNPPGSGDLSSYLTLTDTKDSSFVGKNGFVPVVTGEDGLLLQPIPQLQENGLISGGVVQWTGTGYVFNVSEAVARFQAVSLMSSAAQVTLDAADPTDDRKDAFVLDVTFVDGVPVSMAPNKITGTPSATPIVPQIDPSYQIFLTSVDVPAASTAPTLTEEVIYDENIEWTGSSSGTGTVAFNSSSNPFQGSLSIEATNVQNGLKIRLTDGSDYDLSGVQTLGMQLGLKAQMFAGQNIGVTFLDSSAAAISNELVLSFDKISTDYQFIGVALSQFSFTSFLARSIEFRYIRTKGATIHAGFFLDIIKLEGGINPPVTNSDHNQLQGLQGGDATERYHTNKDQNDAIVGANSPSSSNVFATMADFGGGSAPVAASYASQAAMIAAQGSQVSQYIYFDSVRYWVYLGTTAGTIADYRKVVQGVSPYDLAQEGATNNQVLTWVAANSRYEPVTPSGGADANAVHYNAADGKNGTEKQQALDNIGASAGSLENFSNSGTVTVNDLVITKSNIEFSGASTVTLTGIVALWDGQEVTISNRTGNNLTISRETGSTGVNRFWGSIIIPTGNSIIVKNANVNGAFRWTILGNSFFQDSSGNGALSQNNIGVRVNYGNVGISVRNQSGSTYSFAAENLSGTRLFEVRQDNPYSLATHYFQATSGFASAYFRPTAGSGNAWAWIATEFGGANGASLKWNMIYSSKGGAFFGSTDGISEPTGRVNIRGAGTTTANTLLLEDSAGTDNAKFIDNGQIQFLRLPTSSAGLATGSLWNNSGVINIV